jgi:hypothetical protein
MNNVSKDRIIKNHNIGDVDASKIRQAYIKSINNSSDCLNWLQADWTKWNIQT